MNFSDYDKKRIAFMNRYDKTVRKWLLEKGKDKRIVDELPLFMDGVVNPKIWFKNEFRPLFIMKEPSTGIIADMDEAEEDVLKKLTNYTEVWGKRYDHTGEEYGDIQIGIFPTWMRVAKVAKALEEESNGKYTGCYTEEYKFSFIPGKPNLNMQFLEGLSDDDKKKYGNKTQNARYSEIIEKIAVVNIKKIGSGRNAESRISEEGIHFTEYMKDETIAELIYEQINDIIQPSIIIFCGKYGSSISKLFDKSKISCDMLLDAYHPSYVRSDEVHCQKVINQYREYKK